MTFWIPGQKYFLFKGYSCSNYIYAIRARHLLRKRCQGFLAHVSEVQKEERITGSIPIVKEFLDVFPKEVSGLPPKSVMDFQIELMPGITLISKALYRLAPIGLKDLKKQL